MGKRDRDIEKTSQLIIKWLCSDREVTKGLAEKIYEEVIGPAVEEEREEWIVFSKSAPDSPDDRGLDS